MSFDRVLIRRSSGDVSKVRRRRNEMVDKMVDDETDITW